MQLPPFCLRPLTLAGAAVAALVGPRPAMGQPPTRQSASAGASRGAAGVTAGSDSALPLPASDPMLRGLRWRLVGPFRGGRAVAVTGDPVHPRTFYFGGAYGGVWKTEDAGQSWRNVTDQVSTIGSVGAVTVAPSDPNVVYVGTGESDFREDLSEGDGMYRSTDAGRTWRHIGLADTRHIAAIRVDPTDPNRLYVAAFGHAFGPNPARGVYRSTDGGTTWSRVLFVNDSTGAIDLSLDPLNPRVLYAAMWKFQRTPWTFRGGGGASALYKSTDGGDSWTNITRNPGMPTVPVGRIGVSASGAQADRVYAYVETTPEDSAYGIYRSDDGGAHWTRTSGDQKWNIRPFYYSLLTADPQNANTVYVMNLGTWRSTDGGRTFTEVRGLTHGDDHELWIDPHDTKRMIEGNDGGATISLDGGEQWSTQENQPTAQFYHVSTDSAFPYRIYGAQQDNSSVRIASRSDFGTIGRTDWLALPFGESGYVIADPRNPQISYGSGYFGQLATYNDDTKQLRDISGWLANWDGYPIRAVPERFQWTFPIAFSPNRPGTLYVADQKLWRTTDGGAHWQVLSPDLTRHDSATMGWVGGPITRDFVGTEMYGTIFAFAESPVTQGVLWTGSDDGLLHLSRDDGATWQDVTPRQLATYTRISVIEASHFDAGRAYIAANRYQLDDAGSYVYRTTDFGHSWTAIGGGLPRGAVARVIREDPTRRGLLYLGTETGIYVSLDDGAHWRSLQLNLPRTSVRDIALHGSDLVVATHGRAFWVLDDIAPVRQLAATSGAAVLPDSVRLLLPEPALRIQGERGRVQGPVAANPPSGAVIDYVLGSKPAGEVTLAFLDSAGAVLRTFSSTPKRDSGAADTASRATAVSAAARDSAAKDSTRRDTLTPAFPSAHQGRRSGIARRGGQTEAEGQRAMIEAGDSVSYEPGDSLVPARAGHNRFVWNLRPEDVPKYSDIVVDFGTRAGPLVPPGHYTVRLTVAGRSYTQPLIVERDPRVTTPTADLEAQQALWNDARDRVRAIVEQTTRIDAMERELKAWQANTRGQPYAPRIDAAVPPLLAKLEAVRDSIMDVHYHADEISGHFPVVLYNQWLTFDMELVTGDAAPTPAQRQMYADLAKRTDSQLAKLRGIETGDLAAFNALVKQLNVPAIVTAPVPAAPAQPATVQ